ncbi:MAG TPA: hypothetical protein VEK08_19910 [Planctomycetota bacterium]|nr:hypothetical protein [Planctomycetota bacterium]
MLLSVALSAGDIPLPPEKIAPGVERGGWTLEGWGNPGTADRFTDGDMRYLKVVYTGGDKDKAAFKHITCFGVAHTGKIRMWVYAPDKNPPQIGLALSTTLAFIWHESKPIDLKQGWNKVEIALGTRDWKTETSEWKFTTTIEPRNDIRAVDLVIYNEKKTGVLYVLGLNYDPDDTGEKVAALARQMQSEDAEQREQAEKALVEIGRPAMETLYQLAEDDRPEVLLRAASALRKIENLKEAPPPDPKIREQLEKQREEQTFDDARRRADYIVRGLDTQRAKLLGILKDATTELAQGRLEIGKLRYVDPEKKKAYEALLNRLDEAIKAVEPLLKK